MDLFFPIIDKAEINIYISLYTNASISTKTYKLVFVKTYELINTCKILTAVLAQSNTLFLSLQIELLDGT